MGFEGIGEQLGGQGGGACEGTVKQVRVQGLAFSL
jgi:hypothetical protein